MSFGDRIRYGNDARIANAVRRLAGIMTRTMSSSDAAEESQIAYEIEQIVGRVPVRPRPICAIHPGYSGVMSPYEPCLDCEAGFYATKRICQHDTDGDGHCGRPRCLVCGGPPRPGRVVGLPVHGQSRVTEAQRRGAVETTISDPNNWAIEPGTYPATQSVVVEPISGNVKVALTVSGPSTTSSGYERELQNARAFLATCAYRVTAAYAYVEYLRGQIATYSYAPPNTELARLDRARLELTAALEARDQASKKCASLESITRYRA